MSRERENLLPGLGPRSSTMLRKAGIDSLAQLRDVGSVAAYVSVKQAGCKPSLNLLWGLESVLSGEDWRVVARNHRASLLLALEAVERDA